MNSKSDNAVIDTMAVMTIASHDRVCPYGTAYDVDGVFMKLGLALGSGAMRGMAHIGVLQVLNEQGVKPDLVTGCSIGAVVGGVYACGVNMKLMENLIYNINERDYYDVGVPRMGLIRGERVQKLLRTLTGNRTFADTVVPFACVASDISSGEQVVITDGPLHEAIRASISIPGIFVPHERDGRLLVDGAVIDRVPASLAREMGADKVIAVDVAYRGEAVEPRNIAEVMLHSIEIMEWKALLARKIDAEVVIAPDLNGVSGFSLQNAEQAIRAGREATEALMPEIEALLVSGG